MARNLTTDPSIASLDIQTDAASFRRHLNASNLSPRTVQSYLEAVDLFTRYLSEQGMPTTLPAIRREHVEAFIESLLERFKPSTAANRYAGLRAFFKWAVDEGEIKDSPMAKMRKPKMEEHLTPVLTDDQIRPCWRPARAMTSPRAATRPSSASSWGPVRGSRRSPACAGGLTTRPRTTWSSTRASIAASASVAVAPST